MDIVLRKKVKVSKVCKSPSYLGDWTITEKGNIIEISRVYDDISQKFVIDIDTEKTWFEQKLGWRDATRFNERNLVIVDDELNDRLSEGEAITVESYILEDNESGVLEFYPYDEITSKTHRAFIITTEYYFEK